MHVLIEDLSKTLGYSGNSYGNMEISNVSRIIQKVSGKYYWLLLVLQPAHVKACFLGSSLSIPITDGKLALGTWQGIWFCEHRNHAGSRKLVVTLTGVLRDSTRSPLSPVSPIASTSS